MTRAEKAALKRAAKVDGLADEIALIRLELKKAIDEKDADKLKLLADAVKTLARAVVAQKKVVPEGFGAISRYEEYLMQINEQLTAEYKELLSKVSEAERALKDQTGSKPPPPDEDGSAALDEHA
jgi:hypothetical protein